MRASIAILTLAWLGAAAAAAERAVATLSPAAVYAGEAAVVRVQVEGASAPDLSLRAPDGFSVEGPISTGRSTTIVGGAVRTVLEYGYRVTPPAGATGRFPIGPVVVTWPSGRKEEIPVGDLTVGRRPDRGVRMTVEASPPSGPVLVPFTVTYRILHSGEVYEGRDVFGDARYPLGLSSLSLALLNASGLKVRAVPDPAGRGVRLRNGIEIREGRAEVDGKVYGAIEIQLEVTPLTTGEIDLSGQAGLVLVEGRRALESTAATGPASYEVEELPEEGKPAGFSGAVGRFTIEASAKPREVNAFDPIELTVTVRGEGVLDQVALPRWSEIPEIARDFELDADVDPGKVDGDAKVFKVVLRARSSAVTRIPPLPLPYYDPWTRKYETAVTAAIPLTVRDVKTVRPEEAVGAPAGPAPEAPARPVKHLGIGANFETPDEGVPALAARPPLLTPGFVVLLLAPPLLVAAAFLVLRLRARPRDVPRGTPLSRALAALGEAGDAEGAAAAFAGYLRERLALGPGEVAARDLERGLTARVVPPGIVARAAAAHARLDAARFAGEPVPEGLGDLLREIDSCLG